LIAALERQRSEALAKLTEADRKLRELSPYRALRARYEEVSSVELIPAIRDQDPIPPRYARAKKEMEAALLDEGAAGATSERSELANVRIRYVAALRLWSECAPTDAAAREHNVRRSESQPVL